MDFNSKMSKEKKVMFWCESGADHRIEVISSSCTEGGAYVSLGIYSAKDENVGFFQFGSFEDFEDFMKSIVDAARV